MILAPLVGILLNLLDASLITDSREQNDILETFASMDCADTLISGFQYLLEFNWVSIFHFLTLFFYLTMFASLMVNIIKVGYQNWVEL